MSQSSDVVPGESVPGAVQDAADQETAFPGDNNTALGEISGDEFLREMLEGEEAAGLFQEPVGDAGEGLPPGGDETAGLKASLADLEAKLAETREQLLRKAADFDNFRKRMNQEKQRAIEFANESLLLDIIPIIDDFERAIQSAEASPELAEIPAGKGMLDGISMIEKRLTGQLESKWGLRRFNSVGEPFDPNFHEAMLMDKSPDVEEPTVMEDFARGYTLKDRVIRAAKVKVFMPAGKED
ncbi:MAG: nucleotide exchange factor GrpE [Treponema sp.]|nr:nucleotide exchange factor GrpE [Treponema sp.]